MDVIDLARRRRAMPSPALRRLLREQAGLSQAEVAHALGVNPATVSRWESGQRGPQPANRDAYATLLAALAAEVGS